MTILRILIASRSIVPNLGISYVFFSNSSTKFGKLQEQKINLGKYNINYLKVGHGPHNVLCMPGALGDIWSDFKPQVEGFDREKFTLIAWDPPGYGKSRPPEKDFPPNFPERDADTAFQFMKALNVSKFSVLGWSYGGTASMFLAGKYPETVHKMVVWGARAFITPNELTFYKKIKDVNVWSEKMRKPKIELYGEEGFCKVWETWVDTMIDLYDANDGKLIPSQFLESVRCPTLLLYGGQDPLVNEIHASHLHANIRDSRLVLYPEGKHNIHLKYAEDFNQKVQVFLLET